MSGEAAASLDLKGLKCPLPVLRTRKAMRKLAAGALLVVETTDPLAAIDIPHFCHEDGHDLLGHDRLEGSDRFTLRKGG